MTTRPKKSEFEQYIDRLLNQPEFNGTSWGIVAKSLNSGKTLFQHNPNKLFIPASNAKLFTTAAAISIFGKNYRHKTLVLTNGTIENGILNGNLIIQGRGDPTLDSFSENSIFRQILDSLTANGIKRINGRLIADDNYFDDVALGAGWSWDNLSEGFSAQISALSINNNIVNLTFTPSGIIGQAAYIESQPDTKYISITNNVLTDTTENHISFERVPNQNNIICTGKISPGRMVTKNAAIHNAPLYFVSILKEFLEKNNIESGHAVDIDDIGGSDILQKPDTLLVHKSPVLADIITSINKESENLYAELLLKSIGKAAQGQGTAKAGIKTIYQFLNTTGIDTTSISIRDGSGLSRKNLVSAEIVTELLSDMYKSKNSVAFFSSLPVAGFDGTLEYWFLNSSAKGKVFAKTGTLDHVKALSGYLKTNKGNILAFSILTNHYLCTHQQIIQLQEKICELLINFQ